MTTVSSITKQTGKYAMMHTGAVFIFLSTLFSIYHIMLLAICETQVKKRVKFLCCVMKRQLSTVLGLVS